MKKIRTLRLSQGFLRLGLLPLVLIIAAFFVGGEGIYTAIKNREPLVITVPEYVSTKPQALWVTFKEAALNLNESAYVERHGSIQEMFIAVHGMHEDPEAEVHVLLSIKDREEISKIMALTQGGGARTSKLPETLMRNEFSGLIRFGTSEDSTMRGLMGKLSMNLASGYVILNNGEEPSMLNSVLFVIGGIGLAWIMHRHPDRPASTPPPIPGTNLPPKS